MEPFALLKMMGIFVTGGITGRIVLYLLLLAAGIGVRCALQRRRDFWTAAGISTGLWLVCEIIVDIGAMHEMSIGLFSAAATVGALGFSFALGLGLAALQHAACMAFCKVAYGLGRAGRFGLSCVGSRPLRHREGVHASCGPCRHVRPRAPEFGRHWDGSGRRRRFLQLHG